MPALWTALDNLIQAGDLRATEEVLHELQRKDDDVHDWARQRPACFVEIDETIQLVVQDILRDHRRLLDTRKSRSGADPFVIALAQINDATVVTNERHTGSLNRPHIPDVCHALGVRCINILGLIREQGWVFRL
jgi:hypothetical protein